MGEVVRSGESTQNADPSVLQIREWTSEAQKMKQTSIGRNSILALLFFTVVINYMDRTNISIAAAAIGEDLSISPVSMGILFSAFAWTYSGLQIPGGYLADKVSPRLLYPVLIVAWSLATIAQGFVASLVALVICRVLVGAFEAPSYPINNKIVTAWFPVSKRASAISVYTSGQFIGLAFLTPVLALIQAELGWRGLFIVTGAVGLVWAVVWYLVYRDADDAVPSSHETPSTQRKSEVSFSDYKLAFTHPKLWGIYLGQFCLGTMTIFFLTWFISYLVQYRGIDFIKSGFLASLPFIAAFFGVLLSGFTSDFLTRSGYSASFSRKVPVLVGMLLSTAIIGANFTDDTTIIIACLTVAFFGNGLASITWVFVSLIAPPDRVGLVGGVFNFAGGLSAVVTPIVIGFLVRGDDFSLALAYIAAVAFAGLLIYIFLVGKVEQISPKTDPLEADGPKPTGIGVS